MLFRSGILKNEFHLLTVDAFKTHLRSGEKFPDRSVLITFDDGYADNHEFAVPLLESNQAQALFYICTGNLGSAREFWWDELENLLLCTSDFPPALLMEINRKNYSCSDDINSRKKLYNELLPVLRRMDFVTRENNFNVIRSFFPGALRRAGHRSVTEDELGSMARSPSVVLGAHTVNHCSLAALKSDEQKIEIQKSVLAIEKITHVKVTDFSFPFGTDRDFDDTTLEICRELGMEFVAANIPGCVHAKSNAYAFHRFLVRDWDVPEFRKNMQSFFK